MYSLERLDNRQNLTVRKYTNLHSFSTIDVYFKLKYGRAVKETRQEEANNRIKSHELDDSLTVEASQVIVNSQKLHPLRRHHGFSDTSFSVTSSRPRYLFADGVHVFVDPDSQLETYVYDVHDPENDDSAPSNIISAPNQDWPDDSRGLDFSLTTGQDYSHPWSSVASTIDPCLDSEKIDDVKVLELLLSRWQITSFSERTQIAEEVTVKKFSPESSWVEFEDDRDPEEMDGASASLVKALSTDSNPLYSPVFSDTVTPGAFLDETDKEYLVTESSHPSNQNPDPRLEDLLDDMLSDCIQNLPLSVYPLQAPEFDPDFVTSLCLPTISPLAPELPRTVPQAMDDIPEAPIDYTERAWSYRPLPATGNEPEDQDPICPPPYISSGSSQFLLPVSALDAPPPFPQGNTEIVDLIRMAASLLYNDVRSALFTPQDCQQDVHYQSGGPTLSHLEKLACLVSSHLNKGISALEGVETFKDALDDGIVLNTFIENLKITNSLVSSSETATEVGFHSFIQTFEELELSDTDELKQLCLGNATLEDIAACARAIIQLYNRFGWSSSYGKPTATESVHSAITTLAQEAACLAGELGPTTSTLLGSSSCSGMSIPNTYLLPRDETALYHELLLMIRDEEKLWGILCQDDRGKTQNVVDLVQHLLSFPQTCGVERSELLTFLLRLSTTTGIYPRTLRLVHDPQVNKEPITCGYFGDILRGYVQDQCVCVKVVKVYRQGEKSRRLFKSFMREIAIWGQLQHPNILPFYGVYHLDNAEQRICLVSPWMENGTLVDYLKSCPSDVNKVLLVRDIASALEYVHDKMIVHGDLKGINILVTLCGRACLADFGLASVNDTDAVVFSSLESSGHMGATPRYEAPELLIDCEEKVHRTALSDMYAFGGVCYEIFTGNVPFYEIAAPYTVIVKIIKGEMPTKPTSPASGSMAPSDLAEDIWVIMESCWSTLPLDRPSAHDVLSMSLFENLSDTRPQEQATWSSSKYGSALASGTSNLTVPKIPIRQLPPRPGLSAEPGQSASVCNISYIVS